MAVGGITNISDTSDNALKHKAAHYDAAVIRAVYGPETPKKAPRRPVAHGEQAMLDYIRNRESSGNPTAQNPESSAYGLYGFLDQTWATVGCKKTSDPKEQERCALLYMEQRYGGIEGAYYFHKRMGWY